MIEVSAKRVVNKKSSETPSALVSELLFGPHHLLLQRAKSGVCAVLARLTTPPCAKDMATNLKAAKPPTTNNLVMP